MTLSFPAGWLYFNIFFFPFSSCFVSILNADVVLRAHNGSSESQLGIGESCSSAEVNPPPASVVAVVPNMHRQLPYFLFYSPLPHKVQFNKRMEALFLFSLITHDGGMWGRLPSIGSKGQNHNITITPQHSYHQPPHPNPQYSNSHSNSWTAEVIQVCENTSKMSIKTEQEAADSINSNMFPLSGSRELQWLNRLLKKKRERKQKKITVKSLDCL